MKNAQQIIELDRVYEYLEAEQQKGTSAQQINKRIFINKAHEFLPMIIAVDETPELIDIIRKQAKMYGSSSLIEGARIFTNVADIINREYKIIKGEPFYGEEKVELCQKHYPKIKITQPVVKKSNFPISWQIFITLSVIGIIDIVDKNLLFAAFIIFSIVALIFIIRLGKLFLPMIAICVFALWISGGNYTLGILLCMLFGFMYESSKTKPIAHMG